MDRDEMFKRVMQQRLEAKTARQVTAIAKGKLQEQVALEQQASPEGPIFEIAADIRSGILINNVNYREQRYRKARHLWRRVGQTAVRPDYWHEPGLVEKYAQAKEIRRTVEGKAEQDLAIQKNSYDFQGVIAMPVVLPCTDLVKDEPVELGWRVALKCGSYIDGLDKPQYPHTQSPVYLYRVMYDLQDPPPAEELREVRYAILFPNDLNTQKVNEIKSYTNGHEDDEIAKMAANADNAMYDEIMSVLVATRELLPM